jgi:hypothetical protein
MNVKTCPNSRLNSKIILIGGFSHLKKASSDPLTAPQNGQNSLSSSSSSSSSSDGELPDFGLSGPIAVAYHRKSLRQDSYFLSVHKTRASLFGVPLVIPFPGGVTNIELYEAVWVRVSRLVSPAPVVDSTGSNHAQDW